MEKEQALRWVKERLGDLKKVIETTGIVHLKQIAEFERLVQLKTFLEYSKSRDSWLLDEVENFKKETESLLAAKK